MDIRQQIVNLISFFADLLQSRDKTKTVGVARQQRHFLCSNKENEAKESLTLRWACCARKFLLAIFWQPDF
ncbi:hypothetical protein P9J64_10155 [Deltaproteobacteria bacterium IMCC39524]|nr:hypothetical protein [Deltaproteobacteria bacterium IMCC39524]